jgi:hypothetical protein
MTIVERSAKNGGLPSVIATRLAQVRRRESQIKLIRGLLAALTVVLALLLVALVLDWTINFFDTGARTAIRDVTLAVGALAALLLIVGPQLKRRALADVAADVDRNVPRLEERWQTVSSLSASTDPESVFGSRALFDRVLAESVAREHLVEPRNVVPLRKIGRQKWFLAAALAAIFGLFLYDAPHAWVLVRRFCSPTQPISLTQVNVASSDLIVARGERLRLEASVSPRTPGKAQLFLCNPAGDVRTIALLPDFADRARFGYVIESADQPFSYRFRAGDGQTEWHDVAVFDRPRLINVDFTLTPPAYTKLPVVKQSDLPTNIRAVEGTQLAVEFTVDQPIQRFDIELGENSAIRLPADANDSRRYVFRRQLDQSIRFTPVFTSEHGLANLRYPQTQITVYPDRPPEVVIVSPEKEISVRPDDKVTIEIQAHDDFGVARAEVIAFTGDKPDVEHASPLPPQTQSAAPRQNAPTSGQSAKKDQEGTDGSRDPAKTFVVPIPLADQAGQKKVRARIDLDLRRFQVKPGQELQYLVRVFDSKEAASKASPHAAPLDQAQLSQQLDQQQSTAGSPQRERSQNDSTAKMGARQASADRGSANQASASQKSANQSAANANQSAANQPAMNQKPANPASSEQSQSAKTAQTDPGKAKPAGLPSTPRKDDSKGQSQMASAQQAKAKPDPSQGETSGAQPNNPMSMRQLDVDSQSASSSTMRIHIDKWAGSFEGQQRQKLELLIDPVLRELDAALAKAVEELRPVAQALAQSKAPGALNVKAIRSAEMQILRAQSLVGDLVQKATGTPYAFIGLQLVDITELHIAPARAAVREVKPESAERLQNVQLADSHLKRAREMLADLTKQYEGVKSNLMLAEEMQRIKKMYQLFVEEAMAMLQSSRPTLNPRGRKLDELDLDEEFLKKYTELLKRWERTLAELAKVLGKDPRLLARYMNASRRSADTLRDQLTILHHRQEDLLASVSQLKSETEGPAEPGATNSSAGAANTPKISASAAVMQDSLQRELAEIATAVAAIPEDLDTWLPAGVKADDPQIKPLREQAARILATATLTATTPSNGDKGPTQSQRVSKLAAQLAAFETALTKASTDADPALAQHLGRRLAQVRKLQQQTVVWNEKETHLKAQRFHRALEVDQHHLSEETLALAGKLENMEAQLAGLPEEAAVQVQKMAAEMTDGIKYDVLVSQMSAELGLRDGTLGVAVEHQRKAVNDFARAEERFDKLISRIIEEQNKTPPQVPDIDEIQLQTLEELLARLESEPELPELLGIPNRLNNLQGFRDWMMRSQGGGGGGGGRNGSARSMMNSARYQALLTERARRNALRAIQDAQKKGPQNSTRMAAHWNTLGSRLEDAVRQGRGNTPPRQYRAPIERYFELISRAQGASDIGNPAAAKKPANPARPARTHTGQ